MESATLSTNRVDVHLGLLVLEDEPEVTKSLRFRLGESLHKITAALPKSADERAPEFSITPTITATDNLESANRAVVSGKCDILLADVMVYRSEDRTGDGMASCLSLLRDISSRQAFISVLGHSAYPDLADEAIANGWMLAAVHKGARDSVQRVVDRSVETAVAMARYGATLRLGLDEVRRAATETSAVDRQASLVAARELFSCLEPPPNLPEDYRRALTAFVPMLHRHSTVPSETFKLIPFSPEFAAVCEPLLIALASPLFVYETDAFPAFCQLDAMGYQITMALDFDEKEFADEESGAE